MSGRVVPIETRYNGYQFRSRLEARWAVFFGAADIPYSYEPEGFDLGPPVGFYLPDFFLPMQDIYCEIKPAFRDETGAIEWPDIPALTVRVDRYECRAPFEDKVGKRLVVICGEPGDPTDCQGMRGPYSGFIPCDCDYWWCECSGCGALDIQFEGRAARNRHRPSCPCLSDPGDKGYWSNSPWLLAAYARARSARFEHGEQP